MQGNGITLFVFCRISWLSVGGVAARRPIIRTYACTIVDNATADSECIYYSIFEHNTLISELGGCSACVWRALSCSQYGFCFVWWDVAVWSGDALCACNAAGYLSHVHILDETYCSHEEGWPICESAGARQHAENQANTPCDDRWECHECPTTDDMKKQETVHEQLSRIRNGIFCDLWHSDVPTLYSIIHVIRFHNKQYKRI